MITARNLRKTYGKKVAVENMSFDVLPGYVTGFLGPNGAGKSTTMRLMLGLDAGSGETLFDGKPYDALHHPMRTVGAVLDAKSFHPRRSAAHHLSMLAAASNIDQRQVARALEMVGLGDVAGSRPGRFSLGMGQRLGLAGAILGRPKHLILDEPGNGLDPQGIHWLRDFLKKYAAEGNSVFVSSHLLSEMNLMADRLVVIGQGKTLHVGDVQSFIAAYSTTHLVVASPRCPELAHLMMANGIPTETLVDGRLRLRGADPGAVGQLAAAHGLPLHELTVQSASLEDAFLCATNGAVEYAGQHLPGVTPAEHHPPQSANHHANAGVVNLTAQTQNYQQSQTAVPGELSNIAATPQQQQGNYWPGSPPVARPTPPGLQVALPQTSTTMGHHGPQTDALSHATATQTGVGISDPMAPGGQAAAAGVLPVSAPTTAATAAVPHAVTASPAPLPPPGGVAASDPTPQSWALGYGPSTASHGQYHQGNYGPQAQPPFFGSVPHPGLHQQHHNPPGLTGHMGHSVPAEHAVYSHDEAPMWDKPVTRESLGFSSYDHDPTDQERTESPLYADVRDRTRSLNVAAAPPHGTTEPAGGFADAGEAALFGPRPGSHLKPSDYGAQIAEEEPVFSAAQRCATKRIEPETTQDNNPSYGGIAQNGDLGSSSHMDPWLISEQAADAAAVTAPAGTSSGAYGFVERTVIEEGARARRKTALHSDSHVLGQTDRSQSRVRRVESGSYNPDQHDDRNPKGAITAREAPGTHAQDHHVDAVAGLRMMGDRPVTDTVANDNTASIPFGHLQNTASAGRHKQSSLNPNSEGEAGDQSHSRRSQNHTSLEWDAAAPAVRVGDSAGRSPAPKRPKEAPQHTDWELGPTISARGSGVRSKRSENLLDQTAASSLDGTARAVNAESNRTDPLTDPDWKPPESSLPEKSWGAAHTTTSDVVKASRHKQQSPKTTGQGQYYGKHRAPEGRW